MGTSGLPSRSCAPPSTVLSSYKGGGVYVYQQGKRATHELSSVHCCVRMQQICTSKGGRTVHLQ
eukprot:10624954-Ditylum_brightwellii.AAC.1